jgi:hypothetical protein
MSEKEQINEELLSALEKCWSLLEQGYTCDYLRTFCKDDIDFIAAVIPKYKKNNPGFPGHTP